MNSYIQWFLRHEHRGIAAPIRVPLPIHSGKIADLEGLPKGRRKAAFLCSECGHIGLYSDTDLLDDILGTPCPYEARSLVLVYIEAGCGDNNCESRTKIHAARDAATKKLLTNKPVMEWVVADDLKCECGRQVVIDPMESYPLYYALMPF